MEADVDELQLRRALLGALRELNREQQRTGRIDKLDVEGFASERNLEPEDVRDQLPDLITEGLVEPYAETFGNTARDGACRITAEGLGELRGA